MYHAMKQQNLLDWGFMADATEKLELVLAFTLSFMGA